MDRESYPPELLKLTHAVQYNPNCPMPFMVRLVGKAGRLDHKPTQETEDCCGYGKTLAEAFEVASYVKRVLRASVRGFATGSECLNCGLPLLKNYHPLAGKPEHMNYVGAGGGCLPCAERRANGRRRLIIELKSWLQSESDKLVGNQPSPGRWADDEDFWRHETLESVLSKVVQLDERRRIEFNRTSQVRSVDNKPAV